MTCWTRPPDPAALRRFSGAALLDQRRLGAAKGMMMGKILRKALKRRDIRRTDMAATHARLNSPSSNFKGDPSRSYRMPGSMKK
jgi:hypothetical protein